MGDREITQADWIAYNQAISDAESKSELKEELKWIRDDLVGKHDESDEPGGFQKVKD